MITITLALYVNSMNIKYLYSYIYQKVSCVGGGYFFYECFNAETFICRTFWVTFKFISVIILRYLVGKQFRLQMLCSVFKAVHNNLSVWFVHFSFTNGWLCFESWTKFLLRLIMPWCYSRNWPTLHSLLSFV